MFGVGWKIGSPQRRDLPTHPLQQVSLSSQMADRGSPGSLISLNLHSRDGFDRTWGSGARSLPFWAALFPKSWP